MQASEVHSRAQPMQYEAHSKSIVLTLASCLAPPLHCVAKCILLVGSCLHNACARAVLAVLLYLAVKLLMGALH